MMVIEYKVISSSFILAIVLRIELTPNGQLNFIEFMINVIMHRTSKGLKVELWDPPTFREQERGGRGNLSRGGGHEEEQVNLLLDLERADDNSLSDKMLGFKGG